MNRSAKSKVDRVAGTKLGTLWFLPVYSVILLPLAAQLESESPSLAAFWAAVGLLAAVVFVWAIAERNMARRVLTHLDGSSRDSTTEVQVAVYQGQPIGEFETLVQFEVVVGLAALEATFRTCPRRKPRPLIPTLATLVIGWWSLPWGPISTIRTIVHNLSGGTVRTVASIVDELREPEPVRAPWWKRMLALDTGSTVKVVVNVTILAIFAVLIGTILVTAILVSIAK